MVTMKKLNFLYVFYFILVCNKSKYLSLCLTNAKSQDVSSTAKQDFISTYDNFIFCSDLVLMIITPLSLVLLILNISDLQKYFNTGLQVPIFKALCTNVNSIFYNFDKINNLCNAAIPENPLFY